MGCGKADDWGSHDRTASRFLAACLLFLAAAAITGGMALVFLLTLVDRVMAGFGSALTSAFAGIGEMMLAACACLVFAAAFLFGLDWTEVFGVLVVMLTASFLSGDAAYLDLLRFLWSLFFE